MIIFIVILIGILFSGMKISPQGEYFVDYAGKKQTATINGVFTLLIFLSHSIQYLTLDGPLDAAYLTLRYTLNQLVVAPFLFFSGFGIMESIGKKGMDYVKGIPKNRFFKVWYHYALSLIPFILVNLIFNKGYSFVQTLLSFTGIRAIGNSNWFMLATFVMYIIVFASFMICRQHKVWGIVLTFALTGIFMFIEYKAGYGTYYYNTVLCFAAGMAFSMIKPHFDRQVMKNDTLWYVWAGGAALIFAALKDVASVHIIVYNIFSILFVVLLMLLAMKIKIGNPILDFFGRHVFSFFILQRIPMIILEEIGYAKAHRYAFIVISFICTIILTVLFDKLMEKTDKLIYCAKAK